MENIDENNKKAIRAFLIVYILFAIVILCIIWIPNFTKTTPDFAHYKEYTQEDVATKMSDYYTNDIFTKIILGQQSDIADYISTDYLEYYETSKEEIKSVLNDFGINTKIGQVSVNVHGNDYIYSFDIVDGNNKLRLNVVETYPYKYSITLDDFVLYEKNSIMQSFDKLEISVQEVYQTMDFIEYTIDIKNAGYESLEVNLETVTDAYIVYGDGLNLSLSNPIKYDDETLSNNSSIIKKIKFELPINMQSEISKIVFTNVVIDGTTKTITLDI